MKNFQAERKHSDHNGESGEKKMMQDKSWFNCERDKLNEKHITTTRDATYKNCTYTVWWQKQRPA